MCYIGTWFCMLVAVAQRWGWWIAIELSATKAIVLDSSGMLAASSGGNSLITHSTNAEGIDEPVEEVPDSDFKEMKSLQKAINNCMLV